MSLELDLKIGVILHLQSSALSYGIAYWFTSDPAKLFSLP